MFCHIYNNIRYADYQVYDRRHRKKTTGTLPEDSEAKWKERTKHQSQDDRMRGCSNKEKA